MDSFLTTKNIKTEKKNSTNQKIAIIGSGITGLSAAWLLSKNNEVCIYEKNSTLGGHSNTVKVDYTNSLGNNSLINVDTGFIVFNETNYPIFSKFLKKLNVDTINTNMSFSFSINKGDYEYSGSGLNGIFGQRKNILKYSQWKFLSDIIKFSKLASKHIEKNSTSSDTIIDWLTKNKFSDIFIYNYIIPMSSSIWSCSSKNIFNFPIDSFIYFFYHHGLLNLFKRPQWKTIKDGSIQYINALIKESKFNYKLNSNIKSVIHKNNKIYIKDGSDIHEYDKIIMACHPHQILKLCKNLNKECTDILKLFKYSKNKIVLHTSDQFMPKNKKLWSSWNYFSNNNIDKNSSLQMTYWMNNLQKIDKRFPLYVTMNVDNTMQIKEESIFKTIHYEHPIIDQNSFKAQNKLNSIQGINNIWYSGAWTSFGFHEDGIRSGLIIAEKLGANCPWNLIVNENIKYKNFIN